MKKNSLTFRRLTMSLIALLCTAAIGWAGNFDSPQELSVNEDNAAQVLIKAPRLKLKPGIAGDVDRDGSMTITDVTTLIDALLSGEFNGVNGDVNADGYITISDVTELIDRLLSGTVETRLSVAELALAMDDTYRMMRTMSWSITGNFHQAFGISAYTLAAEVMGDDMIMGAQGSGWFWYDATYNVKGRYTSTAWRSYDLWTAYYNYIAEANSIITQKNDITGPADMVNYYVGQAYALRAYSYFMLVQWFARTYKGHENDPGVPLFEGTVFNGSTGQPRATVAQVYAQIDADMQQATTLLQGKTQLHPEHIGYAVALGLKARIALVKEDWATAQSSASSAISASGKTILEVPSFIGLNNAKAGNVMWGAEIPVNQVGMYASFFAHMSIYYGSYGSRAPKQITKWLYNKMSSTDTRRSWWKPNDLGIGSDAYVQQKFEFSDPDQWLGDYIYMRVEEMYLIIAEAACRRGLTTTARNNLNNLMAKRDPNYTCNKTGKALGDLTTDETGSLLEEILIQRRLELWGEDGRIYTIRRLRQGFERTIENGWPASLTSGHSWNDPECYAWVLTIPQSEFDGNSQLDPVTDQNPLGDYSSTGMHISFTEASITRTTVRQSTSLQLTLTRATSQGAYTAVIEKKEGDVNFYSYPYSVNFADGQTSATFSIPIRDMNLGNDYYCVLTLSPTDIASGNPALGEQITSTRIEVHCVNGNPTGQNISFESETMETETESESMSISVPLTRAITTGDYRATVSIVEGDEQITLDSEAVIFTDGHNSANAYLWVDNMERGRTYTCKLRLSDADAATTDPAIGGQITTIDIAVKRSTWVSLGSCIYEPGLFGSNSYYMTVQRDGNTNNYRMLNFLNDGYNIVFTIDDSNRVYIESQPSFEYSTYGTVYMMGYANEDDSGFAGTYDPNTKKASLTVRYYVPDVGSFPISYDDLTMP